MNNSITAMAIAVSRNFYIDGMDKDDVAQEALVAAWQAQNAWRPEKGSSALSFARRCVTARLTDVLRHSTRVKRAIELCEITDIHSDPRQDVPDLVELRDEIRRITAAVSLLTDIERAGFRRMLNGLPVVEKWDDNARHAARRKLRAAA